MKDFTLYKFRSIVNGGKATYPLTLDNDPRVTRFGRLLRKWKLDELPQLVNVIKGDMQMVGCRPELRCYVDQFPEEYAELLSQAPGITDPASLAFRNEEHVLSGIDFEERYVHLILPRKLILSLRYYRTRTLGSDLYVLLRTIFRVIVPPQRYPSQHSITG